MLFEVFYDQECCVKGIQSHFDALRFQLLVSLKLKIHFFDKLTLVLFAVN